MIEVQKCKSGKINQEIDTKVFKQTDSLIPKKNEAQIQFSLKREALRNSSKTNPILARDRLVTKYRMILNLPR